MNQVKFAWTLKIWNLYKVKIKIWHVNSLKEKIATLCQFWKVYLKCTKSTHIRNNLSFQATLNCIVKCLHWDRAGTKAWNQKAENMHSSNSPNKSCITEMYQIYWNIWLEIGLYFMVYLDPLSGIHVSSQNKCFFGMAAMPFLSRGFQKGHSREW